CPYCGADLTAPVPGIFEEAAQPIKKSSGKRIAIAGSVLLITLAIVGWFAVPWRLSSSRLESETRAREAISQIQQGLAGYYSTEGTYPASLESLADAAHAAAQNAQAGHYMLQYNPGAPEANGRIKSYSLTLRPGNFGFLSFYTDESGILRATK